MESALAGVVKNAGRTDWGEKVSNQCPDEDGRKTNLRFLWSVFVCAMYGQACI